MMKTLFAFSLFVVMMLPAAHCAAGTSVDPQRASVLLNPSFDGENIIIDVTGQSGSYRLISAVFPDALVESPIDMVQEVDLNFDGCKDLLVSLGCDENNDEHCDAFMWDSAMHRFVRLEAFSALKNPTVSGKRFCIMSLERHAGTIRESCYVLQGTQLHCVQTEENDYESWVIGNHSDPADSVEVYLADDAGDYTNIRNSPGGKSIYRLEHSMPYCMRIFNPTNGWWQIDTDLIYEADDYMMEVVLSGSTTGYWIHHTVVGVSTRNYDPMWRIGLRGEPDGDSPVTHWLAPEALLHPIDVRGGWVKAVTADGKHTGWIAPYWLCSNPLTTCP